MVGVVPRDDDLVCSCLPLTDTVASGCSSMEFDIWVVSRRNIESWNILTETISQQIVRSKRIRIDWTSAHTFRRVSRELSVCYWFAQNLRSPSIWYASNHKSLIARSLFSNSLYERVTKIWYLMISPAYNHYESSASDRSSSHLYSSIFRTNNYPSDSASFNDPERKNRQQGWNIGYGIGYETAIVSIIEKQSCRTSDKSH